MRILVPLPILLVLPFAMACHRDNDGGSNPSALDNYEVWLTTDPGNDPGRRAVAGTVQSCTVFVDGQGPSSGLCATPVGLGGWASELSLSGERENVSTGSDGNPEPSSCGPGRLLHLYGDGESYGEGDGGGGQGDDGGGGQGDDGGGGQGDDGELDGEGDEGGGDGGDPGGPVRSGGVFDLFDPVAIGGGSNLDCDEYSETWWTSVGAKMAYLDAKITLDRGTWTLRFVFEPDPLDTDPVFASDDCDLDSHQIDNQRFLSEDVSVMRGDVLVCRKDTATDACADTDFEWLDSQAETFSTSRPSSPLQMPFIQAYDVGQDDDGNYGEVFCNTDCENGEAYCGYNAGGYTVSFSFDQDERFKLYFDWVTDQDDRHPKDALVDLVEGFEIPTGTGECEPEDGGGNSEDGEGGEGSNGGPPECDGGYPPVSWYTHQESVGDTTDGLGLNMDLTLQLDISDFLFIDVEDTDELDELDDSELIQRIHIRDMFAASDPHNFAHTPVQAGSVVIDFDE